MKAKVENWLNLLESGVIKNNNVKVLNCIKLNPNKTIEWIRNYTMLSHQTLTSRMSELQDNGLIKVVNKVNGQINKNIVYSEFVFVSDENERKELAKQRRVENVKRILKQLQGYEDVLDTWFYDGIEVELAELNKGKNKLEHELIFK